jgi:hypothetical protein
VSVGGTVMKLFRMGVIDDNCCVAHLDLKFEKFETSQFCSPWFAESIGVLRVRIGGTV